MTWILLAPGLILCGVFVGWPLVELVLLSFSKTDFITSRFVGLDNYVAMFTDPAFLTAGVNSFFYTILIGTMQVGGAIALSLLVCHLPKRWHDFTRVAFYLPVLAAGIIKIGRAHI